MTTTSPPVVVRDVFPAEVTLGDQVLKPVRVLVTRDRAFVYKGTAGRPERVLEVEWQQEGSAVPGTHAPRSQPTRLALPDGRVMHVNGQRHCGCGNVLKAIPLSALLSGAVRGVLA